MNVPSETLLHMTLLGEAALNADCAFFVANEDGRIVAATTAARRAERAPSGEGEGPRTGPARRGPDPEVR